jgi:hypothetical protein
MSYTCMDHAGWVESNNRAANRIYAKRKAYRQAPEHLSEFQAKVMDILGIVGGGIYNAPITWDRVDWDCGGGIFVPFRDHGFATYDFNRLTMLVFLCHEARIRCDLQAKSNGHLALGFWQRSHEGGMAKRHPNLAEAIDAFREYVPSDHRIFYRTAEHVAA